MEKREKEGGEGVKKGRNSCRMMKRENKERGRKGVILVGIGGVNEEGRRREKTKGPVA